MIVTVNQLAADVCNIKRAAEEGQIVELMRVMEYAAERLRGLAEFGWTDLGDDVAVKVDETGVTVRLSGMSDEYVEAAIRDLPI